MKDLCQLLQGVWRAQGSCSPSPFLFSSPPQATFLFSLIKYTPLTYNKKYTYPWWGDALGWFLALSSMVCIPAWSFYKLGTLKGSFREVGGLWGGTGTRDDGIGPHEDRPISTRVGVGTRG